jgi:hypothetical protein
MQILIFIFQIVKSDFYSSLADRFFNLLYSSLFNDEFISGALAEQFFDLLFSILTEDHNSARILSFVKRIFVTLIHCPANIILSGLLFLARLLKEKPVVNNLLIYTKDSGLQQIKDNAGDIDQEVYDDIESDKEEEEEDTNQIEEEEDENKQEENQTDHDPTNKDIADFDYFKRNPKFAGGDKTALWELLYLAEHYNYMVRKFARMILKGETKDINYKGNPLVDFSRGSIINRLVVRNIKHSTSRQTKNEKNKLGRWAKKEGITVENYKNKIFEDENYLKIYFENKIEKLGAIEKKKKEKELKRKAEQMQG